jgi:hypothetical protein
MQTPSPVRKRLTPAQREEILRACRRSGLSQRDFAAQAGIGVSTLGFWLRKAAAPSPGVPPASFIQVPNLLAPSALASAYRLHLAGGVILEIASGFGPEELASLLQLLGASCSH